MVKGLNKIPKVLLVLIEKGICKKNKNLQVGPSCQPPLSLTHSGDMGCWHHAARAMPPCPLRGPPPVGQARKRGRPPALRSLTCSPAFPSPCPSPEHEPPPLPPPRRARCRRFPSYPSRSRPTEGSAASPCAPLPKELARDGRNRRRRSFSAPPGRDPPITAAHLCASPSPGTAPHESKAAARITVPSSPSWCKESIRDRPSQRRRPRHRPHPAELRRPKCVAAGQPLPAVSDHGHVLVVSFSRPLGPPASSPLSLLRRRPPSTAARCRAMATGAHSGDQMVHSAAPRLLSVSSIA